MRTFSERLIEAMDARGVSQTELSKLTGIDKSLISNYRSGGYKPKQKNLYKIAVALNVSETWLMGYDVLPKRNTPVVEKENKRTSEFIQLFGLLNDEQQKMIIAQIKGILSNQ
ncbi:MAG: helix-turn-helix domain-containing protein [Acutalibacteraceae bacterium]